MGDELWGGLPVGADANGSGGWLIANPSFRFAGQFHPSVSCVLAENFY